MQETAEGNHNSQRQREQAEMLKDALSRPGVLEVMQVYQNWQDQEKRFTVYRDATNRPAKFGTSDRTSIE